MLEYAVSHHPPSIGRMPGMQFINAYFGGKIIDFREKAYAILQVKNIPIP